MQPSQLFEEPYWTTHSAPIPLSNFLDKFSSVEEEESYLVPFKYLENRTNFRFGSFSKLPLLLLFGECDCECDCECEYECECERERECECECEEERK